MPKHLSYSSGDVYGIGWLLIVSCRHHSSTTIDKGVWMMPKVFGDEHATNVAKQEAASDRVHQRHLIIHDAKRRPHYPDEDSANG